MSHLPLIIGHRGASAIAPENTLAAFTRAIQDGGDGERLEAEVAGAIRKHAIAERVVV